MRISYILCIFALLTLASCAGLVPRYTPDGARVRTINAGVASIEKCQFLGPVQTFGAAIEGGMTAAMIKAKNAVASIGGNSMVIVNQFLEQMGSAVHGNVSAEAYRCSTATSNSSQVSPKKYEKVFQNLGQKTDGDKIDTDFSLDAARKNPQNYIKQ